VDGARSIVRVSPSMAKAPEGTLPCVALPPCAGFLFVTLRRVGLLSRRTCKKMAGIATGIGWPVTRRVQQQEMSTWWCWWTFLSLFLDTFLSMSISMNRQKSRQREKAPIEDRFNERDRSSNVRDVEPSRSAPSPGQTKCTGEIKQGLSTSSHSHA
jgi:hypothetical protein